MNENKFCTMYCHMLSDDGRVLDWLLDLLDTFTARDYTLYRSLSHTVFRSRSRCFVAVFNGRCTSASRLTSLQADDNLKLTLKAGIENTSSNSFSIVAYIRCLAMALVLLHVYTAVT
jgi:hypothetical protein